MGGASRAGVQEGGEHLLLTVLGTNPQPTRYTLGDRQEECQRHEARERREAMTSPEGRWRLALRDRSESEVLELVRVHLEKEPLEDPAERRAFAEAVMATGLVSHWRRSEKRDRWTNAGKKILRERARLVRGVVEAD